MTKRLIVIDIFSSKKACICLDQVILGVILAPKIPNHCEILSLQKEKPSYKSNYNYSIRSCKIAVNQVINRPLPFALDRKMMQAEGVRVFFASACVD